MAGKKKPIVYDKESGTVTAVEETVTAEPNVEGEVAAIEELKQLIADNRQFTYKVHDAVVTRLAAAEAAIAALTSQVAGIAPVQRNYPRTKEYTVKDGDTTTKIAKAELGQAGRFTEIATMNYDRYPSLKTNSNNVTPGWKLRLPA